LFWKSNYFAYFIKGQGKIEELKGILCNMSMTGGASESQTNYSAQLSASSTHGSHKLLSFCLSGSALTEILLKFGVSKIFWKKLLFLFSKYGVNAVLLNFKNSKKK